jgi:hypothetical protein
MPNIYKWSNVQIGIETALGTSNTISAISKADPGVATSNGHNLASGDFYRVEAEGMYQVDDRIFRAAGVGSNSFQLEGEDTSLYDTFISGNARAVTFGTFMSTVRGLTAGGGDFDFIDVTTVHDNIRKQIPGLPQASTYTLENLWDATDTALLALKAAADNQSLLAFRFGFAGGGGPKVVFLGYVGATLLPTGNAQDVVVTPVAITMFGRPTIYST